MLSFCISIIIPVYNANKYLNRCLESVIKQTYKNLQIIIVDDGSTDGSDAVCNEYKLKDTRICVFKQENRGVSSARNTGLRAATGDYICFVDADDWIDNNMIENLLNLSIQYSADIVFGGWYANDEVYMTSFSRQKIDNLSIEDALKACLAIDSNSYGSMLWGKLYKTSICKEELYNNESLAVGEDMVALCKAIIKCKKIVGNRKAMYHYFANSNSTMHKINKKTLSFVDAHKQVADILKSVGYINLINIVNYRQSANSFNFLWWAFKTGYRDKNDLNILICNANANKAYSAITRYHGFMKLVLKLISKNYYFYVICQIVFIHTFYKRSIKKIK